MILSFQKGWEIRMDRISAVLILGIITLLLISGVMIHDICSTEKTLVCNDDTSITNHSDRQLWLRVKVTSIDGKEPGEHRIVSQSIKDGCWLPDDEGWYYYSMPLGFAQSTEPFADAFFPAGNTSENAVGSDASGRIRLDVEAIDEAWLPMTPQSGMEAFDIFKRTETPPEILYL